MKIYLKQNVFDAALDRIRWIFDEFENVMVNTSGGKDSVVVMNLALMVAEECGRLPLHVMFIDQEAEWEATVDYIRSLRDDPRIQLDWLQVPFRIFNATSHRYPWLECWKVGDEWIREKEPDSIHENVYGTDRFKELFDAYTAYVYPNVPAVQVAGVRAQESPGRLAGLTGRQTYKWATWGNKNNHKDHYTLYPLYDWNISDVWKAIHDHGWSYNRLYDYMYQYGIPVNEMRVSNLNHETALKSLFFLQEIEPETWNKITARMMGINSVGQLQWQFFKPKELPFMFSSWMEYRDHLLENLIVDPDIRKQMRRQFELYREYFVEGKIQEDLIKLEISAILVNDYHGTKWDTFRMSHVADKKSWRRSVERRATKIHP